MEPAGWACSRSSSRIKSSTTSRRGIKGWITRGSRALGRFRNRRIGLPIALECPRLSGKPGKASRRHARAPCAGTGCGTRCAPTTRPSCGRRSNSPRSKKHWPARKARMIQKGSSGALSLVAYGPLNIPGLKWTLASRMDYDEALAAGCRIEAQTDGLDRRVSGPGSIAVASHWPARSRNP